VQPAAANHCQKWHDGDCGRNFAARWQNIEQLTAAHLRNSLN
jgi:hypothetical protein